MNFIENDQRIAWRNFDFCLDIDVHQNAVNIVVVVEYALHVLIIVEGDVGHFFEILSAKFFHQPCLSNLARVLLQ